MNGCIELKKISKAFAEPSGGLQTVLKDISLDIKSGQSILIQGPSGAGKSTLLNILSGLILPDSGSVTLGDTLISSLSENGRDRFRALHIGYIFQSFNLISPLSVLENLVLPARLNKTANSNIEQEAKKILTSFGLSSHLNKKPYQLSVGQRQRVSAARAILQKPAILLADEPTASLDGDSAGKVIEAIEDLKKQGTTLVMATHDQALKQIGYNQTIDLAKQEDLA